MSRDSSYLNLTAWPNNHVPVRSSFKCLGHYCGRLTNSSVSCGPCPWGSRASTVTGVCQRCIQPPDTHGALYLGFMASLPVLLFLSHLPRTQHKAPLHVNQCQNDKPLYASWTWGFAVLLSHVIAALLVVLLFPPLGTLTIYTCVPQSMADFYSFWLNTGCSYEVAFPYLSLPLTYYVVNAACCIMYYSIICLIVPNGRTKTNWTRLAYVSLYSYPVLCLICVIFVGIFYHCFPYMLLAFAFAHSVYRFPDLFDYCLDVKQDVILPMANPVMLLNTLIRNPKPSHLWTIAVSIFSYSYSLFAQNFSLFWIIFFAVVPFAFYVFTLPFTHPFVTFDGEKSSSWAHANATGDTPLIQPAVKSVPNTSVPPAEQD